MAVVAIVCVCECVGGCQLSGTALTLRAAGWGGPVNFSFFSCVALLCFAVCR